MGDRELFDRFVEQNHPEGDLYLQYRPDFDRVFKRFPDSMVLHKSWIKGVELNNLGDLNRLYFIYMNFIEVLAEQPAGELAELGVYKGNSARLMHMLAPDRPLHLFDTFEGFDARDKAAENLPEDQSNFSSSLEYAKTFIGESKNIIYHKGYFPETTDAVSADSRFAFVNLDCDLYKPMRAGLEYFYPRLLPGGMIVIHDYYSGYWPGVKKAVDEFFDGKPETLIYIPDKSGTVVMRKNRTV